MTKLGKMIKQEAEKKGFTQTEVAEKLGKKQPAVAKIYKKEDMKVSTLKRICEALNISFSRVVKESDV